MRWRSAHGRQVAATRPRLAIAAASDLQTVLPEHRARLRARRVRASVSGVVRVVRKLLRADPERRALRRLPLGRRRLPEAAARRPAWPIAPRCRCTPPAIWSIWTRREIGHRSQPRPAALTDARVRRIAIANPKLRALRPRRAWRRCAARGSTTRCKAKLVMGENISQTAQLVESGNADVGPAVPVARARARPEAPRAPTPRFPPALHPPIEQAAVVVKRVARTRPGARAFVAYPAPRPRPARRLERFGFAVPSPGR